MLQDLRDKAQGVVAWVIIGMIALTFILWGSGNVFEGQQNQVVAKVDGQKITQHELETAYQRLINQANPELKQLEPQVVKKKLLESLINEAILLQELKSLGMQANTSQINTTLYTIPFLQESGHFSPQLYTRFLENARFTDSEFRELLRDNLLKTQLQQGLLQTAFSLDNQVDLAAKYVFQERDFKVAILNRNDYKNKVNVSEEKVKGYYNSHLDIFKSEEQIAIEYITLSLQELENQITPTDMELSDFYAEHKDLFSTKPRVHLRQILITLSPDASADEIKEAQNKADKLYQEIQKGASFEKLAKEHSTDQKSAQKGGELAWISPGELVPEFEKAAFSLEKQGEVSPPFRSEFGYHIIKLIEKEPAKARPMQEVKTDVIKKYKEQVAQEKFYHMVDEINVIAFEQPDTLQPIADKYELSIKKTGYFSKNNPPLIEELSSPKVIDSAFSQPVKEDGNNSELIPLNEQNYIVLRLKEHKPSIQKPFVEVLEEAKQRMLLDETEKLVKEAASKIVSQLKSKKGDTIPVKWQEYRDVTRTDKSINPQISSAAFNLPKPQTAEPLASSLRLDDSDYAVIWLTAVKEGDSSKLSSQEKQSYQSSLANISGELEYALYTTALTQEAKVMKYLDNM